MALHDDWTSILDHLTSVNSAEENFPISSSPRSSMKTTNFLSRLSPLALYNDDGMRKYSFSSLLPLSYFELGLQLHTGYVLWSDFHSIGMHFRNQFWFKIYFKLQPRYVHFWTFDPGFCTERLCSPWKVPAKPNTNIYEISLWSDQHRKIWCDFRRAGFAKEGKHRFPKGICRVQDYRFIKERSRIWDVDRSKYLPISGTVGFLLHRGRS